ncbi:Uncharacterised protein [Legionella wadsworthii]|uniref:Uncharacterized protein n=1 Tax=Legionella wadsworthii TaxID=28088 RepID=A0A378LSU7_9GAMM|nr:hypothetical protein [Legionella wadsworthii]STY28928.1 Uncharacterised protein [Legionella wadsworthii]
MFGKIFDFFSESSKKESEPAREFTSQEDVLRQVTPEPGEKGICTQMANLFTKYQIDGCDSATPDFLKGTPQEIYDAVLKERRHEEELFKAGKDGLHSAFVDSNSTFFVSTDTVKTSDLTDESITRLVADSRPNHIVTYPIKDEPSSQHTVAFGKTQDGQCYEFSANSTPKKHSCDSFKALVKELREIGDPDKPVIIATRYK